MAKQLTIDGIQITLEQLIREFKTKATRNQLKEAQQRRSKRYGIQVLESGSSLTIPARFARMGAKEGDMADPVNMKYPCWLTRSKDNITPAQLGQVRNALVRFEQNKGAYIPASRAKVLERINRARKKFGVGQDTEKADFEIVKMTSDEKRIAYGVALRPVAIDSQGDRVKPEEVEAAAHWYMEQSQRGDEMHQRLLDKNEFTVVESHIARVDEPEHRVIKGDWVCAVKLSPELWGRVKKGEINGFSIRGKGIKIPVYEA